MASYINNLPTLREFFPPSISAWKLVQTIFKSIPFLSLAQWTPLSKYQAMGRTSSSTTSFLNLPGRLAWSIAESVGPLNLIYILYTLPRSQHYPQQSSLDLSANNGNGIFGTTLPLTHELMGLLYIIHYMNRAIITPWFGAPSMSPIHLVVASLMALFQYMNSTSIGGWLCYTPPSSSLFISILSILGLALFTFGLAGNITAEWTLFSLRCAAAKRKAKSEGRATITYDKVYVIPDAKGVYKYVLYPHYSLEWVEWLGYWILGGAWGLGWTWGKSAAAMFLINEIATMTPRAYEGLQWYEKRFGRRPVAGRKAVVPGLL